MMSEDQIKKLRGRISALELLTVVNELSSLKGSSREAVIEAAKGKAEWWSKLGKALEDDESDELDKARTQAFEDLGKLVVEFSGPIADHVFGDGSETTD